VPIDGARAMGYLKAVCALGPRMSGTEAMTKQQALITKHFEGLGAKVKAQTFDGKQVSRPKAVEMTNLVVSFQPDKKRRVILCTHYDTRPLADQEKDERNWTKPFLSANDGGSGVALLMELGHAMKDLKTTVGVDFVFFDGEEYVFKKSDDYFIGSKHFAQTWKKGKDRPDYAAAVLFDMIAGKGGKFLIEGYSWTRAEKLCREVWGTAQEQKCGAFVTDFQEYVRDDHIALQDAGIPAIDVIDFSYPHWHKLSDTPENCSPESMAQVAKVVSVWVQRVK